MILLSVTGISAHLGLHVNKSLISVTAGEKLIFGQMASKAGSHSFSSKRVVPPKPPNFVHSDCIHRETVRKELALSQLRTDFFINPYRPGGSVAGKVNSLQEAEMYCASGDETMSETLLRALRVPTAKYTSPTTSSHEYGWYNQALTDVDRNDARLSHPRCVTDVTKSKELEWRSGLQTRSSSAGGGGGYSRRTRSDGAGSTFDDRQR